MVACSKVTIKTWSVCSALEPVLCDNCSHGWQVFFFNMLIVLDKVVLTVFITYFRAVSVIRKVFKVSNWYCVHGTFCSGFCLVILSVESKCSVQHVFSINICFNIYVQSFVKWLTDIMIFYHIPFNNDTQTHINKLNIICLNISLFNLDHE